MARRRGGTLIANLQVLRGLAALSVVFYHTGFAVGGVHTEFQGVAVFFVISGFIMTYITRRNPDRFLQQRLLRIVPLYWLCTTAAIALGLIKGSGRLWAEASLQNIASSLLFIPYRDQTGELHPLLLVGWTLNLEMFFYLIIAGMLTISRRWATLLACAVLLCIRMAHIELGCASTACEFYAHNYTMFFVAGVICYYAWDAIRQHAEDFRWFVVPVAAGAILVFIAAQWTSIGSPYLAPPLLVLGALMLETTGFRWRSRFALLVGAASYAMYLTHTFALEGLKLVLPIDLAAGVGAVTLALTVCTWLAIVVHRAVEARVGSLLRLGATRLTSRLAGMQL